MVVGSIAIFIAKLALENIIAMDFLTAFSIFFRVFSLLLLHTDFVTIQTKHYSIESVIWKKTAVVYGANKAGFLWEKCHGI